MKNCIGYLRVSTEEQCRQGFSLEAQELQIKEYCKKQYLNLVQIYRDEGISGKSIDIRPGIQSMLKYAMDNKNNIHNVVVWKLNRLSRKSIDTLNIIDWLTSQNISLISINEGIDSLSTSGKIMVHMLGVVSEIERDNIISNVKNGMEQRAREGLWNGNSVYGYDLVNKKLIISPKESEVIKLIYKLYVESDKGYKAITQYLNTQGYRTKQGNLWSIATVRDKLKNPVYAGYIVWGKYQNYSSQGRNNPNEQPISIKGTHESIITEDMWLKAQEKMKSTIKATKVYDNNFLLSGLLKCPKCGGSMVAFHRANKKNGQVYRYYQCYNAKRKGTTACNHNLIQADYVEAFVLDKLNLIFNNESLIGKIINDINSENKSSILNINEQLSQMESNLRALDKELAKLREYLRKGVFTEEEYEIDKQKLYLEKQALEALKQNLINESNKDAKKETYIPKEKVLEVLRDYKKLLKDSPCEKVQLVLKKLLDKVTTKIDESTNERIVDRLRLKIKLPGLQEAITYMFFPPTCGTVQGSTAREKIIYIDI